MREHIRNILLVLMIGSPLMVNAAGGDLFINQRDATDTATINRIVTKPATDGVMGFSVLTQRPVFFTFGPSMSLNSGVLDALQVPGPAGPQGATGPAGTPAATPVQSPAARTLNTVFQVSATRPALVTYSVQITVTASIAGGQQGDVIMEIASNAAFTAGVQTVAISGLGQTYTLAVAIQGIQPQTGVVSGLVPAGYYVRLRTASVAGSPVFLYRAGQENLL